MFEEVISTRCKYGLMAVCTKNFEWYLKGIKEHVCHYCGTGFAWKLSLQDHIQRIHEHSGKFICAYCDFRTIAQMKLDIHVNEVHTKAIKYPCPDCNFFCYRKGGLAAHIKTVHLKLKLLHSIIIHYF